MEKLNKQYLKQLSHYSWLTLISIISILGVSAVFYLLAILFSGHIDSIGGGNLVSMLAFLRDVMVLVLVIFSICTPYQIFKEAIANGVSRWTNWLAHHLMVITVLVVAWLMNALIELLQSGTVTWSQQWAIIISMLIGVTTAGALGNLYGLMSMRWKIILTIALLASFFVLCWLVVRLALLVTPERVVMMIQSINHPIVWNGLGLIWVALMVGIDYLCALHMQLRRD
ncbi:hypothetical protein HCZ77_07360 [Limosilactobacillus fermentum]|uniref:hypothetical protein n=1 Tax=Limosilactobacillus fermentum TaxID=1613 RepID=UPI0013C54059|nr:hypothetical protein [Limosilactobacillus fermentum]QID95652.1 hypothetical protein GRE01_07335 [Limosilactobacillus fermentum]